MSLNGPDAKEPLRRGPRWTAPGPGWAGMDATDRALLAELQRDARQSNRDLAAKLGLAPSTCLERVRALRARGVITGYHAAVSLPALGRTVQALVAMQVRPLSRDVIT